jgi:hypothetical protein
MEPGDGEMQPSAPKWLLCTAVFTNDVTAWGRVPPVKPVASLKLFKKYPELYGTQISSTCSRKPATCPNPEPDQSSPHLLILFLQDPF